MWIYFLQVLPFGNGVSARIMNSNFKTVKYIADWKCKTWLIAKVISRKGAEKNRLILRHPKNQTPAKKVSLVKHINEGYVLFHLFLFLIFLQKKIVSKTYP